MTLWQIDVRHFCCGILVDDAGIVRHAAPIMRWAIGKSFMEEVVVWVASKRGKIRKCDS